MDLLKADTISRSVVMFTSSHCFKSAALKEITNDAMKSVWNKSPWSFQRDVIPHILQMQCDPNLPRAVLLVQGTGGGNLHCLRH